MMLVATLIVVPIHFMLAGEMKLLHQPSAFRHGVPGDRRGRARRAWCAG